ncbi:unnamed protein product, partial [marine sediment metagenome]
QFFHAKITAPTAKINNPIGPVAIVPMRAIAGATALKADTSIKIGPPTAAATPTT